MQMPFEGVAPRGWIAPSLRFGLADRDDSNDGCSLHKRDTCQNYQRARPAVGKFLRMSFVVRRSESLVRRDLDRMCVPSCTGVRHPPIKKAPWLPYR